MNRIIEGIGSFDKEIRNIFYEILINGSIRLTKV